MLLISGPVLPARPAAAQEPDPPRSALFWAVNVGVATVSALIDGIWADASLQRILAGGIAGGSLMYAGQRIVGTGRPAARLLGLETVALGAGVTRNVARGLAPLSDLNFPVFPFYVRVRSGNAPRVSVRLSAMAAVSGIRMAARSGRRPDFLESLYSGALVFDRHGAPCRCAGVGSRPCPAVVGEHQFGALTRTSGTGDCDPADVTTHELGHVTQDVRDAALFAIPASDFVLGRAGGAGRWLSRYVVVDLFLPLMVTNELTGPSRLASRCGSFSNIYECETESLLRR